MTRIISGSAGGRRSARRGATLTRPTSDRVREALFSALQSMLGPLEGLRFLDLYAGSGAVGLESLSRGAAAAALVEQDRRTAALVRGNVDTLGFGEVADVVCSAVGRFLAEAAPTAYDVVFLDPPYGLSRQEVESDLGLLVGRGWLTDDAVVVVERSARDAALAWPGGLAETRVRRYGETALVFGTCVPLRRFTPSPPPLRGAITCVVPPAPGRSTR